MDLKDKLLEEALRLETQAGKLREAAKLLGNVRAKGTRRRARGLRAKCKGCGRGYIAHRKTARFCSNTCRAQARRKALVAMVVNAEAKGRKVKEEVQG